MTEYIDQPGRWRDVVIGSKIRGGKRTKTDVWEIVDMRHGDQVEDGMTLWMKGRNVFTGEEFVSPPHGLNAFVMFKVEYEGEGQPSPRPWPTDSDDIMLLVEELGATPIATRDNATGEIMAPSMDGFWGDWGEGFKHHLRIAHGMDVTGLDDVVSRVEAHGRAHRIGDPLNKGGFPHRHASDDPACNVIN